MCGWCLAYCTGVVLNTVRESATPDSKENKQADAGSRRFRRHFLCGAFFCNFSSTVCVCVCVFSSHSFWTSSSLDVPAGVTQEEGHTEFLIHLLSAVRALIFLARRIQPFLSLVDREVEFCVLTI